MEKQNEEDKKRRSKKDFKRIFLWAVDGALIGAALWAVVFSSVLFSSYIKDYKRHKKYENRLEGYSFKNRLNALMFTDLSENQRSKTSTYYLRPYENEDTSHFSPDLKDETGEGKIIFNYANTPKRMPYIVPLAFSVWIGTFLGAIAAEGKVDVGNEEKKIEEEKRKRMPKERQNVR